ncbi:MAG: serine--tRNA ligase [Candidatus Saccharibacteria bacterium]|nr:serine--tRNA ligase [Candidatus Saccharibacteria bacterium]
MIDIKILRENPQLVRESADKKGYNVDVDLVLEVDILRRKLQQQAEELRAKRNEIADKMKGGRPEVELVEKGKELKEKLSSIEVNLNLAEQEFTELISQIPNFVQDEVPIGAEEKSVEVGRWGENKSDSKDHLDFALARDWVDFERGAKVAGSKFYYLKGDLALLEQALIQYAIDFVGKKGFTFMSVPHMVNSKTATGTGFAPRSSEQSDEYYIEGEDLSLIATSEIPLTGYHSNEVIDEKNLPLLYTALSPCYRKEAGTYGKHTRGLFRVHQFNKLEMYALTTPEASGEMHEKIREIEEELWQSLGIPYHVINIASGDLGAPAAKKYDLEYWSSVDNEYRELTSCSNCTDFQARNLNIRVRKNDGKVETLHTLNGTAVATTRSLIAIIENYQQEDGKLQVPEALRPYMSNREVL